MKPLAALNYTMLMGDRKQGINNWSHYINDIYMQLFSCEAIRQRNILGWQENERINKDIESFDGVTLLDKFPV